MPTSKDKGAEPHPLPVVRLSQETLVDLETIAGRVSSEATVAAIDHLLKPENSEKLFNAFMAAMQRSATKKVGKTVLGGFGKLGTFVFWVFVGLTAVYSMGDWGAMKAAWTAYRAISSKGTP